jgi:hypothetical protein
MPFPDLTGSLIFRGRESTIARWRPKLRVAGATVAIRSVTVRAVA